MFIQSGKSAFCRFLNDSSFFDLNLVKTVSQLFSSFDFKNYNSASLMQSMISIKLLHGIFSVKTLHQVALVTLNLPC